MSMFLLDVFESIVLNIFFFFQAEDGIRDKLVTGVQTCALPISRMLRDNFKMFHDNTMSHSEAEAVLKEALDVLTSHRMLLLAQPQPRSVTSCYRDRKSVV